MSEGRRKLFSCYGVELEYMIVRRADLGVAPWADRVLVGEDGRPVSDIGRGTITWSNELTAHVLELKCSDPVGTLDGLADAFAAEVREVNRRLATEGAELLPTAMHPGMRPEEAVLWKHEFSEVYETFDRIFDCRGHGWSNVQSVHINLPFATDEEFGRLHAAIRLILPLLPALAASSPLVEGRRTGRLDNRLEFYRKNSARLPPLCGRVIPERAYSEIDYQREIFDPIAAAVAPHDPAGVLEPEFTNSRGAIARFARGSIEIRLLDVQECPAADLAIVRTVVALLRELVAETLIPLEEQKVVAVDPLADLLIEVIARGGDAPVHVPALRKAFGMDEDGVVTARELWGAAIDRLKPGQGASRPEQEALEVYRTEGTLAERILQSLPPTRADEPVEWAPVYRRLRVCLQENRPFRSKRLSG